MNRLGLRLMRGFCNKQLEKINKSEILGIQGRADNTVIGGSSAAADIIIKQLENLKVERQQAIENDNFGKSLNFATQTDGKTPVLESYVQNNINIFNWNKIVDIGAFGFVSYNFMYSAFTYFTTGAVALYGLFALKRLLIYKTIVETPKIITINKLSDGNLQIVSNKSGYWNDDSDSEFATKDNFRYGVRNPYSNNVLVDREFAEVGVWCEVNGRSFLICGQTIVNNHLFNELL